MSRFRVVRLVFILSFSIACYTPIISHAQQAKIDSLTRALSTARADTTRVNLMNALAEIMRTKDTRASGQYAAQALQLAEQTGYARGAAYATLNTGMNSMYDRKNQNALECFEKSLIRFQKLEDDIGVARSFLGMGLACSRLDRLEEAHTFLQNSLKIAEDLDQKEMLCSICHGLGSVFTARGNNTAALRYYQRCVRIAEEINSLNILSRCLEAIGVYHGKRKESQQALEIFQRTLKIQHELGERGAIASTLRNIGSAYTLLGAYQEAIDHYQMSMRLAEGLGKPRDQALCLRDIGLLHILQDDSEAALQYYLQSLAILDSIGVGGSVLANLLTRIGMEYGLQGSYTEALPYFQRSLQTAEKLGNKRLIAFSLNKIGTMYSRIASPLLAVEYYKRSLRIMEELGDKSSAMGEVLCNIGWYYSEIGDHDSALIYYTKGLRLAEELQDPRALDCPLSNLHIIYDCLGDHQKAYEYHLRYSEYLDSTRTDTEKNQLKELMTKYESEQKQKQIELLEKDKALQALELRRSQEELRRKQLESLQRSQALELLTFEHEIQHLEIENTSAALARKDMESRRMDQELTLARKDRELQAASIERQSVLRNAMIAGIVFMLVIAALIYRRIQGRRREAALRADAAEFRAKASAAETHRLAAEHERKEKESQRAVTRRLIETQEQERQRIAGDLHDSLGQELVVIRNRAQLALRKREDAEILQRQLREVVEMTHTAMGTVREIAHNLRPTELDRLGLTAALRTVLQKTESTLPAGITKSIDDIDGIFPHEAEIFIYRIVQEGIGNVIRHAEAQHADVRIRLKQGTLDIMIEDDGRGLPAGWDDNGNGSRNGMGLRGMQERAEMLGGSMTILSAPGDGMRLRVLLPVPANDTASSTSVEKTESVPS